MTRPVRNLIIEITGFGKVGFLYFAWVLPYLLLLIIAVFCFRKFILSLPYDTLRNFFIAGAIFITGAVGIELIEAKMTEDVGHKAHIAYKIAITIEETLEMTGIILFIKALLLHLHLHSGGMNLVLQIANEKNIEK